MTDILEVTYKDIANVFGVSTNAVKGHTKESKSVYLASGWFTPGQERRVKNAEVVLKSHGLDVFSPREHQFGDIVPMNSPEWREMTFRNDVHAIHETDFMFAIYDEMDSGTMWEIGYAYAIGKPIILFNESEDTVNLMQTESIQAYLTNWYEVVNYDFDRMPYVQFTGNVH